MLLNLTAVLARLPGSEPMRVLGPQGKKKRKKKWKIVKCIEIQTFIEVLTKYGDTALFWVIFIFFFLIVDS